MGIYTYLHFSTDETPPHHWLSKQFPVVQNARPGESRNPLPADLARAVEPLTRFMDDFEEEPTDDLWQPPTVVLAAADAMLAAVRTDPGPLVACGIVDEDYYTADRFAEDLEGLREVLQWAVARGIPRVRFLQG